VKGRGRHLDDAPGLVRIVNLEAFAFVANNVLNGKSVGARRRESIEDELQIAEGKRDVSRALFLEVHRILVVRSDGQPDARHALPSVKAFECLDGARREGDLWVGEFNGVDP